MSSTKVISLIVCLTLALAFTGCEKSGTSSTTATPVAGNNNANANPPASQTPNAIANNNMTANSPAPNEGRNARVNKDPEPKIGAGGNDFYLFTQTRAALNADGELKNSNIAIDIKNGSVKLSSAVASAEQKTRAEQLIRAVPGVSNIQNQLSISASGAKR
jgi:hypothetical protein